uniref:SFRICE_011306 n=1 Tax=Spodoptera frugiperda TaxID=7108 RepID=A0A2H1WMB2_SPOFR
MEQTLLSMLVKTENFLCVYRNYDSEPKYRKIRILRIIIELVLISGITLFGSYELIRKEDTTSRMVYCFVLIYYANFFCACTTFICAVQNSSSYAIFARNIIAVQQRHRSLSQNCSRKLKNIFIITIILLPIFGICLFGVRIFHRIILHNITPTFVYVALVCIEIVSEIRFSLEHYSLSFLNKYITELQAWYESVEKDLSSGRGLVNDPLTEERIEEWANDYMMLVTCSKCLSKCFSFQKICFPRICEKKPKAYLVEGQIITLDGWMSCQALNPTTKTKSIKNLYLLVKSNPIKIEYTGKVVQGMYLIPMILSLSVSYVIIALQFNHLI